MALSLPVPTRRFAGLAVLGAAAIVVLRPFLGAAFALVEGCVVAAGLVDWLLTPSPRRVHVERRLQPVLTLGAEGSISWRVENQTRRPLSFALADALPPSWRCPDRRTSVRLAARTGATITQPIRPARRGRFEIETLTVRVAGPLGLMARQADRSLPATLRVYPAFHSKAEAELRLRRARILEVGLRSAAGRGGGTDFDQLRDYQVDDETRRLDWAATARAGRPIVRTYRAERNQHVVVVLDCGRPMALTIDGAPRLEHALDAILAVSVVASRLGDKVACLAHDDAVRSYLPPTSRPERGAALFEALYQLTPVLREPDYRAAFAELEARVRRRSLVVVFTDLAEGVADVTLAAALPLLCRRHVVVVAAVSDPTVLRWAQAEPADVAEGYRKAAAHRTLAARATIARRLEAGGAIVVDAPPRRLAIQVVDTYLNAKATGRL